MVIPRPTLPIPTVSASVADQSYSVPPTDWQLSPSLTEMMELEDDECRLTATRRQRKALPLFSAAAMQKTQPISTPKGFVAMPRVVPHDSMKIKPLLYMDDIPRKNRAAVGVSTVRQKAVADIYTMAPNICMTKYFLQIVLISKKTQQQQSSNDVREVSML